MTDSADFARIFLVTPARADVSLFPDLLRETLAVTDVAAVLVAAPEGLSLTDFAAGVVPIIQDAGAAALIADDSRIAGRLKADGVHIGTGFGDLRTAAEALRPARIVGAGNIHSRHAAMEAGEAGADYIFFGRPHGDTHDEAHPKALDLAEWWSDLMEIPAVMMAGRSVESLNAAAATGVGFVALHQAVWGHASGPAEALRRAADRLGAAGRRAA